MMCTEHGEAWWIMMMLLLMLGPPTARPKLDAGGRAGRPAGRRLCEAYLAVGRSARGEEPYMTAAAQPRSTFADAVLKVS